MQLNVRFAPQASYVLARSRIPVEPHTNGMKPEMHRVFLDHSTKKLQQMAEHLDACLDRITDEQAWRRNGSHQNSVGNLILHVCGNAQQWIISGVGGQTDIRNRDAEFSAAGGLTTQDLRDKLHQTVTDALAVLEGVTRERMLEEIEPQGRRVTVLEAIYQVVGHFQQHTGQIIFATKIMSGEDLKLTRL